eukprot:COSAG03_NODE_22439_length_291_cov_0.786458_1_plen_50_part_01
MGLVERSRGAEQGEAPVGGAPDARAPATLTGGLPFGGLHTARGGQLSFPW